MRLPNVPAAGLALPGLLTLSSLLLQVECSATTSERGPSPEILAEHSVPVIEIGLLRIHNISGGVIEGSLDSGKTWRPVGHVLQPTVKVNPRGYTASKYAPVGTVAATAVNAIHLKAGQNTKENRGIIWSLSPAAETRAGRLSLQSEISPGSSAFTDIPGGTGIFGGIFTPFVGNPVHLDNQKDNQLEPLPDPYTPRLGDVWVVRVMRPLRYPREIIFENRFGGLITIQYRYDPRPKVIGQVLRPVQGVGRFVGSYFSDVGRLRANHTGVIDVSTSPRGKVGSFQIVPANHAMSPETHYIRTLTQWMVVGPVSALDPSWEGIAPLYSSFLRPRHDWRDRYEEAVEGLAGRFWFDVRKRGSTQWQPMPTLWLEPNAELPEWAGTALSSVTHLRIVFPFRFDNPGEAPGTAPPILPTAEAAVPR